MNQDSGGSVLHWFLSVVTLGGTVVSGVVILATGEYAQIFASQNALLSTWICVIVIEGYLMLTSLMALHEANQKIKQYELHLITLLRRVIDSKGFAHYLTNLAKNPSSNELLAGFKEQVALASNCLEMILWSANKSTLALLHGIVSDKISRAVPAKGSEEKWHEVVAEVDLVLNPKETN